MRALKTVQCSQRPTKSVTRSQTTHNRSGAYWRIRRRNWKDIESFANTWEVEKARQIDVAQV